jgi:hypothetical protein
VPSSPGANSGDIFECLIVLAFDLREDLVELIDNYYMTARSLDHHLYHWISVANERADRYGFPPGMMEESLQKFRSRLGEDYLLEVFEGTVDLHLLGLRGQELGRWLRGGANVDDHVIQVLDLASTLEDFADDPHLRDKIDRLKRSSFWPSQFELAMAGRAKRTIESDGSVELSPETGTAAGDFAINWKQGTIVCECARLAFGNEEEQYRLMGDLYHYVEKKIKKLKQPCCAKIRLEGPLVPTSFTSAVRALKTAFSRFTSTGAVSIEIDEVHVEVEPLTENSERIPFRYIDGKVQDVLGSEWVTANSFSYVNAKDDDEVAAMYRAGVDFAKEEYARVFLSWQRNSADLDPYARIRSKIKKKRHQTKAGDGVYGRLIFLESQWDMDLFDRYRLQAILDHELEESHNTIAVFIAQRCTNVHYRRWYKYYVSKIGDSYRGDDTLLRFFERLICYDRDFDPVLKRRYLRTWEEAALLVQQHEAEYEEQNQLRERDL